MAKLCFNLFVLKNFNVLVRVQELKRFQEVASE